MSDASLLVRGGPNSGMIMDLTERPLTFGRRSDGDVMVDDSSVSRRHAMIVGTPAGFVLRDLNSANGIYVGRNKISEEHLLRHGDRIRMAKSEVTFIFRQDAPATAVMTTEPPEIDGLEKGQNGSREELGGNRETPAPAKESQLMKLMESHQGAPVSREEIVRHVWPELHPERVISSQEIDKAVARLRSQIEDDPRRPKRLIAVGEYGFLLQ